MPDVAYDPHPQAAIETLLTEDLLIREEEQEYLIPRPGEKTRQKGVS